MAMATLVMGFFQESIAEAVSGMGLTIPHVPGLLPFMFITIAIFAWLVWFYYVKRLDLTKKIAAQPLMQVIHRVLFNGYFIEYLILWFSRNFIVQSLARSVNWSDRNVVDGAVNGTVPFSRKVSALLGRTATRVSGENAGAMALGLLLLLAALMAGGAA